MFKSPRLGNHRPVEQEALNRIVCLYMRIYSTICFPINAEKLFLNSLTLQGVFEKDLFLVLLVQHGWKMEKNKCVFPMVSAMALFQPLQPSGCKLRQCVFVIKTYPNMNKHHSRSQSGTPE